MAKENSESGFILTQHWLDRGGECRVVLAGIGEHGPFELQIPNRPVLFVAHDAELPKGLPVLEQRALELTNFDGDKLDALYFSIQQQLVDARQAIREQGMVTFESDINPPDRFRIERFIHGAITTDRKFDFLYQNRF